MAWRQRRRRTQGSQLASSGGGGGGSGCGSSRRGPRFRDRVAVRRRPGCPPPCDPLGECASPVNHRGVRGSLPGGRAALA
ncbi:Hypothetical predicted protein [Lynx pardinus]|uniref:Uncharacterized protein n=1 Tax=Lynx pardinus TaxID=191816 RepID=A0A485NFZ2_LYNPA|nr:Hypothetical predicted protein [Lynx pardinus]